MIRFKYLTYVNRSRKVRIGIFMSTLIWTFFQYLKYGKSYSFVFFLFFLCIKLEKFIYHIKLFNWIFVCYCNNLLILLNTKDLFEIKKTSEFHPAIIRLSFSLFHSDQTYNTYNNTCIFTLMDNIFKSSQPFYDFFYLII